MLSNLNRVKYNNKLYFMDYKLKEFRSIAKFGEIIEFLPFEKINFAKVELVEKGVL